MIPYIGDFAEDATVYHYFNTFSSDDPSASITITNLTDANLFVYKDGSVTDIVTDGATVVIDFDSRIGMHKVTIDTSIHADYAVGSDYMVMMNGTTVDAATITAALFSFSIENRYNAAADDLANATDGLGALKTLIDTAQADLDTLTGADGAIIASGTQTFNMTGSVTGNLSGSVGSVTGAVGSVTGHTNQTGDTYALANGATGFVAIDTVVDTINTQVGTAGAGLTNLGGMSTTMKGQVNTEADAALADIGLDHLISSALPTNWATDVASGSVFDNIADDGTAAYDRTTDSLQAIRDRGDAAWTSFSGDGSGLTSIPWNASWDAEVQSEVTDALNAYDPPTNTEMVAAFTEIKGATWSSVTDTLEAIRDRGDAAWVSYASDGSGLTSIPWNASWDAEVQSEVTDALNAYDPPTNTEMVAAFTEIKGATWAATDSLEAIRNQGDAAWTTATSVTVSDKTGFSLAADQSGVTIGTVTTNTDMRGTDNAALATAMATAQADLDLITGTDGATLATAQGNYAPSVAGDAMTLTAAYDFAKGTVAMTEAYAANGAAPTPAEAMFAMHQMLMQFGISSTALTVRKLDDSTTAFVVTLDDATSPTDAKRV